MKTAARPAQRSMGFPEGLHPDQVFGDRETREKAAREKAEQAGATSAGDAQHDPEFQIPAEEAEATPEEKAQEKVATALENLKGIGVDLTPQDFRDLLYKGSIEKEIKLSFDPTTRKPVLGIFKTLTPGEFDELDECIADEVKDLTVTRQGLDERRSGWTMAFVLLGMEGARFVPKVVVKKDEAGSDATDTKAMAKLRKRYISRLNAQLVNKALAIHNVLTTNLRLVMEDPEGTFFGKP